MFEILTNSLMLLLGILFVLVFLIEVYSYCCANRILDAKGFTIPHTDIFNPIWYQIFFAGRVSYVKYINQQMSEHKMYGNFLLNSFSVVVNDLSIAHKLLSSPDFEKKEASSGNEFLGGMHIARTNVNTGWKKQHDIIGKAFRKPETFDPIFDKRVKELFNMLGKEKIVDNLAELMQKYTLDVLGDSVFGWEFNTMQGSTSIEVGAIQYIIATLFGLPYNLKRRVYSMFAFLVGKYQDPQLDGSIAVIDALCDDMINKTKIKLKENKPIQTMLDYILDANTDPLLLPSERLSNQEVKDNLKLFFIAGHESTALALTHTLYLLAQYPEIQEEIRKDLENGHADSLENFLLETMRLYSPVVSVPSRICIKDCELGGYHIPKGTVVGVSVHGIQQSESIWTEPEKFIPSRWNEVRMPYSKVPSNPILAFSHGSRICTGKGFSDRQQRHFIKSFLASYKIEKCESKDVGEDPNSFGLCWAKNIKVKFIKI